ASGRQSRLRGRGPGGRFRARGHGAREVPHRRQARGRAHLRAAPHRSGARHRRTTLAVMTTAPVPMPRRVSDTFDPHRWREVPAQEHGGPALTDITYHRAVERWPALTDITYHRAVERIESADGERTERDLPTVRIAFDRPEVRNAFRPHTVDELYRALDHA